VHERGNVNQLHDYGEVEVVGVDFAGGATGEKGQKRAKTFAPAADCIHNVALEGGIECRGLLCNPRLDFLQMRLN
jgi:hypothetical protein